MSVRTPAPPSSAGPRTTRTRGRTTTRRRRQALTGWAYATPTAIFVTVLFLVPLALVFKMSASHWPLLSGDQGWNFPDNFTKAVQNRFFVDSVIFTLKYTVLATVLLIGLGSDSPCSCRSRAVGRACCAPRC